MGLDSRGVWWFTETDEAADKTFSGLLNFLSKSVSDTFGRYYTKTQADLRFAPIGSGGGGGPVVAAGVPFPILRVRTGVLLRNVKPVVFIFDGSSTTAGSVATTAAMRYVNQMMARAQAAWPLSSGAASPAVRTLAQAVSASPLSPGVQGINNGDGGTTSADFITSANIASYGQVTANAALTVFVHMVGANDWSRGNTIATYKANYQAKLKAIDDVMAGRQYVVILARPYERMDAAGIANHVAEWEEFGVAMSELAALDPEHRAYVDISPTYYASGVPDGGDPFGLISSDDVHQGDIGHTLMADLMGDALVIPRVAAASAGVPGDVLDNTAPPTIAGTPSVGQVLTASPGTWTNAPTGYAYQWRRNGANIAGATASTYTLVTGDAATFVSVAVTASRSGYSSVTAVSATVSVTSAAVYTIASSDSYGLGAVATMAGQSSDAVLGGSPLAYASNSPASFGRNAAGQLVPGGTPATAVLSVDVGTADHASEWILEPFGAGSGSVWIDFRRAAATTTAADCMRAIVSPAAATIQLGRRTPASTTPLGSPVAYDPAVRHTVRVEARGVTFTVLLDGAIVGTTTDSTLTTGSLVALTMTSTSKFAAESARYWRIS